MNLEKSFYTTVLRDSLPQTFTVRFWDGDEQVIGEGDSVFRIIFRKPIPQALFLKNPELAFAEAYMKNELDVEGDLVALLATVLTQEKSFLRSAGFIKPLTRRPANNLKKSRANAAFHYDVGNDFYQLWLDDTMTYSCAYFQNPDDPLTRAQQNKVDLILGKLSLCKGQTLLDIGCGWGELIIRAAKVWQVKTTGITLSQEQYEKTRDRIAREGLTGQVSVALIDYREMKGLPFDRIVSVGMAEHLGQKGIDGYFAKIAEILNPGGLSLLHCITRMRGIDADGFTEKYIFPGGYVPMISELVSGMAAHGFNLLDVESLRRHYAKTLSCWRGNFEQALPEIRRIKDETFIRMWRLYLASSEAGFLTGNVDVHQFLFAKGINDTIPWVRSMAAQTTPEEMKT